MTHDQLVTIDTHLRKAEQCKLMAEVVASALEATQANPILPIDEAIRIGMQEWDILSKGT